MAKRKLNDNQGEEERAIFVDTSLDTHLIVLVSPLLSFSTLKERIVMEHSKCFPDQGEIKITALKVQRGGQFYYLSESILLRTAFLGFEGWFVFADVAGTPISRPLILQSNVIPNSHQFSNKSCKALNIDKSELTNTDNSELGASSKKKWKKRNKIKGNETALRKDSASGLLDEKNPGSNSGAAGPSLSETNFLLSGCTGKRLEAGNVVEHTVDTEMTKMGKRSDCKTGGHLHDASFAATDATVETRTTDGDMEGTSKHSGRSLNQDVGVDKAGAGPRSRKSEKRKQVDADKVDRSQDAKLGQIPDVPENDAASIRNDTSLSERKSIRMGAATEGTVPQVNEDAGFSLSQHEPSKSTERAQENEEVIDPLHSATMNDFTELRNTTTKRKTHKAKDSTSEKKDLSVTRENNNQELVDTRKKEDSYVGKDTSLDRTVNQESGINNPGVTSGSQVKKNKSRKKKDADGVNRSLAAESDQVSVFMTSGAEAFGSEKAINITEPERSGIAVGATPLQLDNDPNCRTEEKEKANGPLRSFDVKETAEPGKSAKKRKASTVKTSVTAKGDQSSTGLNHNQEFSELRQEGTGLLEPAEIENLENVVNSIIKPRTRSQSKPTLPVQNSSEASLKDQLNDLSAPPDNSNLDEHVGSVKAKKRSKKEHNVPHTDIPETTQTRQVDDGKMEMTVSGTVSKRSKKGQNIPPTGLPETPQTEQVDEGKGKMNISVTADEGHLTDISLNGIEQQRGLDERHDVDELPVQQDLAGLADVRNLDKQKSSKIKRKKLERPPSVDTSSNWVTLNKSQEREGSYLVDHQPQISACEADGIVSLQKPQVNELELEIQSDKPSKRTQKKQSASAKALPVLPAEQQLGTKARETDWDLLTKGDDAEFDSVLQQDTSLQAKHHDGLAEVRKQEKRRTSEQKKRKRNVSSSVDTLFNEHNVIASERSKENQRNVQVISVSQTNIQEEQHLSQIDSKSVQLHNVSQHAANVDNPSDKPKKKTQRKLSNSEQGLSSSQVEQHFGEEKTKPEEVGEAKGDLTNGKSNAVEHRKRVLRHEKDHDELSEIPSQEVSSGPAEVRKSEKPRTSKQKVKNPGRPSSVDTASKEENFSVSGKIGVNTSLDVSLLQKSLAERHCDKNPHEKLRNSKEVMDPLVPNVNSLTDAPVGNNHIGKIGVPESKLDDGSSSSKTSSSNSGSSVRKGYVKEVRRKMRQDPEILKSPVNKNLGQEVSAKPQKKSLSELVPWNLLGDVEVSAEPQKKSVSATIPWNLLGDVSSKSSDDDVERNGSSSSTQTPSEEFSSDYSEGESKGDVVSSQHDPLESGRGGMDKTKSNPSASKKLNLTSVLRSSSSFKKAKLIASQSQTEDIGSQPEFLGDI